MKIRKKKFRLEASFEKILLFFRLSKHKGFEIEFYFKNEFNFNSEFKCFITKRPSDDWKCAFEFENSFLYLSIGLIDYRLWDEYSDRPINVSYQKYNEMYKNYTGKSKYKYRTEKTKWFLNTKHLKIYNHNFLNDIYGRTIDLAFYRIPLYFKFGYGFDPIKSFDFQLDIVPNKNYIGYPWFCFKITLFSLLLKFEFGKNTVMREENLFNYNDFIRLANSGADLYLESNNFTIIDYLAYHNRYEYLKEVLKRVDINKFDKVELLTSILFVSPLCEKCFDLVLNAIDEIDTEQLKAKIRENKAFCKEVYLKKIVQKFKLEA